MSVLDTVRFKNCHDHYLNFVERLKRLETMPLPHKFATIILSSGIVSASAYALSHFAFGLLVAASLKIAIISALIVVTITGVLLVKFKPKLDPNSNLRCAVSTSTVNLHDFAQALENNQTVVCTPHGEWHQANVFRRFFYWLGGVENHFTLKMARIFNSFLAELEQRSATELTKETASAQYRAYIRAGEQLLTRVAKCRNAEGAFLWDELSRRILALEYRSAPVEMESKQSFEIDSPEMKQLIELAATWKRSAQGKRKHALRSPIDAELSAKDRERLGRLQRYPKFLSLLLDTSKPHDKHFRYTPLQELFFNWVIRDGNQPDVLVVYPDTQQELRRALLASRIGHYESSTIRIHSEAGMRSLQMRFEVADHEATRRRAKKEVPLWPRLSSEDNSSYLGETQWIQITDRTQQIPCADGRSLTIQQIFDQFAVKRRLGGDFEMFRDGIRTWRPDTMTRAVNGKREEIDLSVPYSRYWEQMPKGKWISFEEISKLLPTLDLQGGENWIVRPVATRQFENLGARGTHAFMEVLIPETLNGERGYCLYSFGKGPKERFVPTTFWGIINFMARTFPADVVTPDTNIYCTFRQLSGTPISVTPTTGLQCMEVIRGSIQRCRDNQSAYSIFVANCANWVARVMHKVLKNPELKKLYVVPFENSQPPFPLNQLFKFFGTLTKPVRNRCYYLFFKIFGGSSTHQKTFERDGKTTTRIVGVLQPLYSPWNGPNSLVPFRIPASANDFDTTRGHIVRS